jgi:hypothetical protein
MNNLTRCLVGAVTIGVLSGCGTATGARPGRLATTPAQARAFARTVNLREADVLGWQSLAAGGELKVTPTAVREAACAGRIDPSRRVLYAYSNLYGPQATPGRASLRSGVLVWPTPSLASVDAAAGLSPRGFACFVRSQAPATVHTSSGRVIYRGRATVTRFANPLVGVADAYDWHTTWTITLPRAPFFFHTYEDILGFVAGPAEVVLVAQSTRAPIPPATESQALEAMYARARRYKFA